MRQLKTGYLPAKDFNKELEAELQHRNIQILEKKSGIYICEGPAQAIWWAQQTWQDVQFANYESISAAAKLLQSKGKKWLSHQEQLYRRAQLIEDKLRIPKISPIEFLTKKLPEETGVWTLLSEKELMYSAHCKPSVPEGIFTFQEDKTAPSRAYLKLWELFTLHKIHPQRKELCLEVGASPGGWTWVLASLGCRVIAVDRTELDLPLMKNPLVEFKKGDAFAMTPEKIGTVDWIFSDLICVPEKLYEWLQPWLLQKRAKNYVCTLKFKGEVDFKILQKFADIPGSFIVHLGQNKHELTWVKLQESP